jgi:hypothetical protein
MYCKIDFEFKIHLLLNVHRQIDVNAHGRRLVILEGKEVCLAV